VVRLVNLNRGRKYINTAILLAHFTPDGLARNIPEIEAELVRLGDISLLELTSIMRRALWLFLREECLTCLLTSKRISILSKAAHLDRKRKMAAQIRA
jgi:hypothetical protein